jgi:glycosyltransferase involved in cell wall biosynthesis
VFEYAAMGKPVVASRLPMVERTFPAGTVATYPPGDADGMAASVLSFADDPIAREAAVARTAVVVERGSWEHEATGYLSLVERLIAERGSG